MTQLILKILYLIAIAFTLGNSFAVFLGMFTGRSIRFINLFKNAGTNPVMHFASIDYKGLSKKLNLILFMQFEFIVLGILLYLAKPTTIEWVLIVIVGFFSVYYFFTHPYDTKRQLQ